MGSSLKHDNLSKAGETSDNTKWNFHYARSCYHHHRHPQRNQEAKVQKGAPGGRWRAQVSGGMSVLVGESAPTARCKRLRELMQGGLCWTTSLDP